MVQVPNNDILTQNVYQNHYYPNPKYLIIGYMDPLGIVCSDGAPTLWVWHLRIRVSGLGLKIQGVEGLGNPKP